MKRFMLHAGLAAGISISPLASAQCERGQVVPDNPRSEAFGTALAIHRGHTVVGGSLSGSTPGDLVGVAYVFRMVGHGTPGDPLDDAWQQLATLTPSDSAENDGFGSAVAMYGDTVVVGAPSGSNGVGTTGAAYVFQRNDHRTPQDPSDDTWDQQAKLVASDGASGDMFGGSVAVSASHLVVGAVRESVWPFLESGSAYVFQRDERGTPGDPSDDAWIQQAKLTADDASSGDRLGASVAMEGDIVVAGAYRSDEACLSDPNCDSGSVYVFRRDDQGTPADPNDDIWVQQATLLASDAMPKAFFGRSVSISGDSIAVGAPEHSFPLSLAGAAYVFRRDDQGTPANPGDDVWVEQSRLVPHSPTAHARFGTAVSVRGGLTVVGATKGGPNLMGSATVFALDDQQTPADPSDDVWVTSAGVVASDSIFPDEFGQALSVGKQRVLVGAPKADSQPGHHPGAAYWFDIAVAPWTFIDGGLPGAIGVPSLFGFGSAQGDAKVTIRLQQARPTAPAWLVVGLNRIDLPFSGGSLVPSPDLVVGGQATDPTGLLDQSARWPPGVPAGTTIYFQSWIPDANGWQGWAATNAIQVTTAW